MTPQQFFKQLQAQREELKRAIARTLPVMIGNEAVNFARDNFRKEGFMDGSLKPWTPAKRKSDPKHPDRAYATLSSRRMHLYKTPTIQNETEYSTDIPNASGIRCSVFPNPTNENSQVMLELDRDYHTMGLSITDITGRSIYHLVSASPLERGVHYYQLPFSCLPNGVLFLTFYSGTEKCTVRIIK